MTRLSPEPTIEILSITREALTNVRKHARASPVDINVTSQLEALLLTIADIGIGLDSEAMTDHAGHGLHNMQERAQALRGKILFNKIESGGTLVQLEIPFIPSNLTYHSQSA